MDGIILGPLSEGLALVVEQDAKGAPQKDEGHVQHYGRDIAVRDDPGRDELAEAIAPQVLVDGDGDEDAAGHGLVAVHGICRGDGWDGGDLDTGTCVSDDDDDLGMCVSSTGLTLVGVKKGTYLPIPFVLIAEGNDEITKQHDQDVRNQGWQSHFGLSNTFVSLRGACRNPIAESAVRQETDHGTDEDGEVSKPDALRREVVWRCCEVLRLSQVDGQEGTGGPGYHEGTELDDREREQFPRDPEIHTNALERVGVVLPHLELPLCRDALMEIWVSFGGLDFCEFCPLRDSSGHYWGRGGALCQLGVFHDLALDLFVTGSLWGL